MYRVSAGIETRDPGYKHQIIQPHPSKKLSFSKASFESAYGLIASGWERKESTITVSVKIPANTTATIILPAGSAAKVKEGGKTLSGNTIFSSVKSEGQKVFIEAGSGNYTFEYQEE
jgi:alpha-L-rhamnosidase